MTSKPPASPASSTIRYSGLDGLRAVAVTLVVGYHLFPPALLPGGFIGVDVFFVISGFLITTLLLREHAQTGRIALGGFWKRRARRLLPALALVVTVCATAAWVIGGDVLLRLGDQVLGAFTFSYNWVSIAGDAGYFGGAAPELFRNFWSLAVEEQFYVLWPLILPLFLLLPRAWGRVAATLALAAASAMWMGVVVTSGEVTRAYFGTDTHAFGILLGVALAFALAPRLGRAAPVLALTPALMLAGGWKVVAPPPPKPQPTAPGVRAATGIIGTAALAALIGVALLPPTLTTATFPGATLTASALSAVAIAAAVWPGSVFGPAMDVRPLRWIGDRSYGIYLWHWPLLVLAVAAGRQSGPEAGFSPWLGAGVLVVTLVAAELSYRFVETPVRRRGFRGALRELGVRFRGTPAARLGAIATVTAGVLVIGGTSAAVAAAPAVSSSEAIVAAGIEALEAASATPLAPPSADPTTTAAPVPPAATASSAPPAASPASPTVSASASASSSVWPSASPSASASESATATPTASASPSASAPDAAAPAESSGPLSSKPSPVPSPTAVAGDQVTAVGDSVMLASAPGLLERLPGIQVDAAVSRQSWQGAGIVDRLAGAGMLRPYVVVALGTNGSVSGSALERIAAIAGPDRHLILVTAYAPRSWIPGVNADLAAFAESHPGVVIADWAGAIADRTDLLAGDHVHPGREGGRIFAEVIAGAIDRIEQDRAQQQYERELRLYRILKESALPVGE
ncbi:MAG: acyltransferase family protein [Microbacterium sp.]